MFDKRVGVSISNEHITVHTSEAFRVVLLFSSNLFMQGGSLVKHNEFAKGIILVLYNVTSGVRLEGLHPALNYKSSFSVRMFSEDFLLF